MSSLRSPTWYVLRVERSRGPVWYAKCRVPDGRQVQKKIGPAWSDRGRPPIGFYTRRLAEAWLREVLDEARHARGRGEDRCHVRGRSGRGCGSSSRTASASRRRSRTIGRSSTPICFHSSGTCRSRTSRRSSANVGGHRLVVSRIGARTSSCRPTGHLPPGTSPAFSRAAWTRGHALGAGLAHIGAPGLPRRRVTGERRWPCCAGPCRVASGCAQSAGGVARRGAWLMYFRCESRRPCGIIASCGGCPSSVGVPGTADGRADLIASVRRAGTGAGG